MAEKRKIGQYSVTYDGIFSFKEIMKILTEWISEYNYKPNEISHTENVKEAGRHIFYQMNPFKEINEYVKYDVWIEFTCSDMTDVVVEIDGKNRKMNKGNISVAIIIFLTTDYENMYEDKPFKIFFRSLYDKYIGAGPVSQWIATLKKESVELKQRFEGQLNLYKFGKQT